MTRSSVQLALAAVLLCTGAVACGKYTERPLVERLSPEVSPSRLRVLATVAGTGARMDLQISATVRKQLTDSGVTVLRHRGRFESQRDAVSKICGPEQESQFDGVIFVWYNRLELHDCATQRAAYEVSGGQVGIQQMTNRLLAYLRRDAPAGTT